MRILYIGAAGGTSGLRSAALSRMGNEVTHVDPYTALPAARILRSWAFNSGAIGFADHVRRHVTAGLRGPYDIAFVDNGELVSSQLCSIIRQVSRHLILYNLDNPFTPRDRNRWRLLHGAISDYDLVVTPRDSTAAAARAAGAKNTLRVWQSADEVAHLNARFSESELAPFRSRVSFVGTWMPERGETIRRLRELGLPLKVFGPRWDRARELKGLEDVHTVHLNAREYATAIAASEICLVLLSRGNEDLHTTRTMEIPAVGSVLCAPRTADHLRLYGDGSEALFWDTLEECAHACLEALRKPEKMKALSASGKERLVQNQTLNEACLRQVLAATLGLY